MQGLYQGGWEMQSLMWQSLYCAPLLRVVGFCHRCVRRCEVLFLPLLQGLRAACQGQHRPSVGASRARKLPSLASTSSLLSSSLLSSSAPCRSQFMPDAINDIGHSTASERERERLRCRERERARGRERLYISVFLREKNMLECAGLNGASLI